MLRSLLIDERLNDWVPLIKNLENDKCKRAPTKSDLLIYRQSVSVII